MRRRALPTRKKRGFANSYEQRNMSSPITTTRSASASPPSSSRHQGCSRLHADQPLATRRPGLSRAGVTPLLIFFGALAALGLVLAAMRFFSPLGPSPNERCLRLGNLEDLQRHDLTALGSAPLAWAWRHGSSTGGSCTWSCEPLWYRAFFLRDWPLRSRLRCGPPWNFYSFCCPGAGMPNRRCLRFRYACHCTAPSFCFLRSSLVLERYYYTARTRPGVLRGIGPFLRKIYPFVIVGAYVLP